MSEPMDEGGVGCDVLVVGAGPTGLTLAAQLRAFGATVRIVDKLLDRAPESRALAVQPRTLEVLRGLDVATELVARGNPAAELCIHAGDRVIRTQLFDIGLEDTAFPFLLFISQAETEVVLTEHLAGRGVRVERNVEFVGYRSSGDRLACTLRHPDGTKEVLNARYLAGCDGAHSTVRELAGIPFVGASYPQTFLLADLDVAGLQPGAINTFLTDHGPLFFFPLDRPAPWRLITMRPEAHRPPNDAEPVSTSAPLEFSELQRLCDRATEGRLRLSRPVWATAFRLHHRHATKYLAGKVALAGDAAHIHSPAGAQGMNTGIQDAWNLGWKLGLVCRGVAPQSLLHSYEEERRPVGQFVVRFTDRVFTPATSTHPVARFARTQVAPRVIPAALRFRTGRGIAFRTVSQLGVRYRNSSAIEPTRRPVVRRPRAGDRLPDGTILDHGTSRWLHEVLAGPRFSLLLCGPATRWDTSAMHALSERFGALLSIHRLDRHDSGNVLFDPKGLLLRRLRVRANAVLVIRPDGHIGCRADDGDVGPAERYLARWLAD